MPHVIDASALNAELAAGRSVRLLDIRWRLDAPEGRPSYLGAHIPGAVYVDLERELARLGHPEEGRYPLPSLASLQDAARRWGINDGDLVVAYDDNDAVAASRAWWLLRRRGIDVRVLDGGVRSWFARGLPLESGDRIVARGHVTLDDNDPGVASIQEAGTAPGDGTLVDVRAPEHYRGHVLGLDPVAGHIPGAVNIPTISHTSSEGTFRDPADIRAGILAAGVDPHRPVILYCGVGVASTHSALAFALAGIDTRVYPGAWSQWSRSPGRPVAVGRTPAGTLQGW